LDGSDANAVIDAGTEREGDTNPFMGLAWKKSQYWQIKVVEYARPQTMGYALQALMGSGSDNYTAPTLSTTLSAGISAGASSFSVNATLGTVGTAYFNFTPGYSSASYEVANVNLASRSGAGPYTYSLVGSGTFAKAHSSSDTVNNVSTHAFTRQLLTYDPYTIEIGWGSSSGGPIIVARIQDCVCYSLKLTSEAGLPLKIEHDWYGSLSTLQSSLSSTSFEDMAQAANVPFLHYQAAGVWSLDGSNSGSTNAATIKKLELTIKNSTGDKDFLTEQYYPVYFIPSNIEVDGNIQVVFQHKAQYYNTYYGTTAPTLGTTTDSYLVGYGALTNTWTVDGINTLALTLPNLAYTAAKLTPKLDGKPVEQQLVVKAIRSIAQPTPVTVTLSNSANAQY
jgi:hypothetical protein